MRATAVAVAVAAGALALSDAAQTNICGTNVTIGNAVIAALNLTYPGLEAVASAAASGDLNTACEALADYYVNGNSSWWLRMPAVKPGTGLAGGVVDEMVFNSTWCLSGVDLCAPVPRDADGGVDWLYYGPRNDPEFMHCLNRHDSFVYLLQAFAATGNPLYPAFYDALVIDWVTHLPCPGALSRGPACVPLGVTSGGPVCSWEAEISPAAQACHTGPMDSPWRSLEMGIRMGAQWPESFFGFASAPNVSTSARVLLPLAVGEHMQALAVYGSSPNTANWQMTQWQGLVTACTAFPELKNTSGLLQLAVSKLQALLESGVYPDGVETEMASGYDMGTAGDFFGTLQQLRYGGQAPPPSDFTARVEAMWEYGSFVSDPTGCLPRNGDSDLCGNGYNPTVTAFFNRSDWQYVHSNGASGTPPAQLATTGPSNVWPWAGQVVMRSGYDAAATWVFFDVGPYGSSGHAHRDKLNVLLHARGSMLLADSGRFAYAGTDLSATLHQQYAHNTEAHNTLTFDGCDQQPMPALAAAPVANGSVVFSPLVDTAFGSMDLYDGLQGNVTHTRGVRYQRVAPAPAAVPLPLGGAGDGDWLVVVDMVVSDRPRSVQATWHTHPNATGVSIDASTLVGVVGGAAMLTGEPSEAQACVIPATGASTAQWSSTSIVRGQQQDPSKGIHWQGWYSQSYDDAWPASTLVYNASVPAGTSAFAWLIVPSASRGPCDATIELLGVSSTAARAQVTLPGQAPATVTIPLGLA